jgi:xylulose-5-phosphate/fructose-6-phosphate phosphoketolase
VNLIIAGKQPAPVWLDMNAAIRHCTVGLGIWEWASNGGDDPDVVMACCGDVPTLEILAAVCLLREQAPDLKIRVVNVVDLMALQPVSEHPHGIPDEDFDRMFTTDKPVIFAFHGYPWIIHRLTYRRKNHGNIHVRGFKEEGTTTTPFDMCVRNDLDRYRLALDAIRRVPKLHALTEEATQKFTEMRQKHKLYVSQYGEDLPEVRDWRWNRNASGELSSSLDTGSDN